ncbi:DUF1232 domain-containing protein [Candidatus Woesearchaeota archaeon]|nr:DUF1232 domain-containing protein [Candidatus Woesearchaeota archaeon]
MNVAFASIKKNVQNYVSLGKNLKNDRRVPRISKILLIVAIVYFLSPIDLIPDFIPIVGQLDDIFIVPSLIFLAVYFIPREVFREHYDKIFS